MSLYFNEYIKLPQDRKKFENLVEKAKHFALTHAACMRSKSNFDSDSFHFAPFTLLPSPFPRTQFEYGYQLQPILNKIIYKVAHDEEFLHETLASTVKVDNFTAKLFEIYEKTYKNRTQKLSLGLIRADYMLESSCARKKLLGQVWMHDHDPQDEKFRCLYCCLKQVEVNTIAAGFGHMGPVSRDIHEYILDELGESTQNLPQNSALQDIASAIISAWQLYNEPASIVLFVIEEKPYNICDQRFHEFKIRELNPGVRVFRKTLTQIASLSVHENAILVEGFKVAVVYFRAGYCPDQYPSETEWKARLMIEESNAIKCPSIHFHLAGTKKVQQALTQEKYLTRFVDTIDELHMLQKVFTGLYSLDKHENGMENIANAIRHPERYILKPQREGGGNNVFGKEIPNILEKMTDEEAAAWILMDTIIPPMTKGFLIRPNEKVPDARMDLVSEIGFFGAIIGNEEEILYNKVAGHMFRTKLATANEGGVASGLGALDSPYLI